MSRVSPLRPLSSLCFCGRSRSYALCCQPIVEGQGHATTAEDLMRSRYSAFCIGAARYLLDSWDPNTRPPQVAMTPNRQWLGLEILATELGGVSDRIGTVEFKATFSDGGVVRALREASDFRRESGHWVYSSGIHKDPNA